MCAVSMIMDHYHDKWATRSPYYYEINIPYPTQTEPPITDAEIREFRELLERARQYDKTHNQPDCELESKKQKVRELAEKLGVTIDFL